MLHLIHRFISRFSAFVGFLPSFVVALTILSSGCVRKETALRSPNVPVVTKVEIHEIASPSDAAVRLAEDKQRRINQSLSLTKGRPLAGQLTPPVAQPAISAEVTLNKSAILDRVFLYGSDLQYSSFTSFESKGMMIQAMAIGHMPAKFAIVSDRLQLLAEQTHLYESKINHPPRLINQFEILRQDQTTLTIAIRQASPLLVTLLGNSKALPARSSWIRSVEFIKHGDYLLMETSIETADGTVAEFMESVFPRESLVTRSNKKPILDDVDLEPLAERYQFISSGDLYLDMPGGRTQTRVASRFPLDPKTGVIDWYVTPNVPAEYLPMIQAGVEGWNRYSQKMWSRDFVHFAGVLPSGVKIGDPRFNVINWDSVPDAEAAYESQASDPLTGLQSHSLIYLPYAWVKIGLEYWKDSQLTQEDDAVNDRIRRLIQKSSFIGAPVRVPCLYDITTTASLHARRTPEVFAKELLKQVLFHEVGHALGLSHNFKGSLSYDPENAQSAFTTSIMDYNQFQLEDGAFTDPTSADGSLLEYDRQVISVLYNDGADVSENDPVLPSCDDEEADDVEGGVDPLCIRYDAGSDPTEHLIRTARLTIDPEFSIGKTRSFASSLMETTSFLREAASVTTSEEASSRVSELVDQLLGVSKYYYTAGAQSLSYMGKANIRSLRIFQKDVLPENYEETAMRERVRVAIEYISNLNTLEKSAQNAFEKVSLNTELWLTTTPWFLNLSPSNRAGVLKTLTDELKAIPAAVEAELLVKLRAGVLSSLTRIETAPFFFAINEDKTTDYERFAIDLLEGAVSQPWPGTSKLRPVAERAAAATALTTYGEIIEGKEALERVRTKVRAEIPRSRTAIERENLRKLLKILEGSF